MWFKPVPAGLPARRAGGTGLLWGGCSSRVHPTLHLALFTLSLVAVNQISVALSEEEGKPLAARLGASSSFDKIRTSNCNLKYLLPVSILLAAQLLS